MRVVSLDIAAKTVTSDITYSTNRAFIWTQVESCVGIICACLPTLKAPVTRYLPRLLGGSSGKWSSSQGYSLEEGTGKSGKGSRAGGSRIHTIGGTGGGSRWKDRSESGVHTGGRGLDTWIDAGETSSQEQIVGVRRSGEKGMAGIHKTVDVTVVSDVGEQDGRDTHIGNGRTRNHFDDDDRV
jgi:hypothetical protein